MGLRFPSRISHRDVGMHLGLLYGHMKGADIMIHEDTEKALQELIKAYKLMQCAKSYIDFTLGERGEVTAERVPELRDKVSDIIIKALEKDFHKAAREFNKKYEANDFWENFQ